jgi:hypothetical protein
MHFKNNFMQKETKNQNVCRTYLRWVLSKSLCLVFVPADKAVNIIVSGSKMLLVAQKLINLSYKLEFIKVQVNQIWIIGFKSTCNTKKTYKIQHKWFLPNVWEHIAFHHKFNCNICYSYWPALL